MRASVKRSLFVVPVLVTLALGVVACSGKETGTPTARETPTAAPGGAGPFPTGGSKSPGATSSSVAKGPLAGTSPCSLLSESELGRLGARQNGPEEKLGYARSCQYKAASMILSVAIFEELGLKDITQRTDLMPLRVGDHEAVQALAGAKCAISIATSESSRVDVGGTHIGGDEKKSCQAAMSLVQLVEPKLP